MTGSAADQVLLETRLFRVITARQNGRAIRTDTDSNNSLPDQPGCSAIFGKEVDTENWTA